MPSFQRASGATPPISSNISSADRRGEGAALGNLGLAYADLGEVNKAIEFYKQVLVIAREIGDRRGEGSALGNLGNAYLSRRIK